MAYGSPPVCLRETWLTCGTHLPPVFRIYRLAWCPRNALPAGAARGFLFLRLGFYITLLILHLPDRTVWGRAPHCAAPTGVNDSSPHRRVVDATGLLYSFPDTLYNSPAGRDAAAACTRAPATRRAGTASLVTRACPHRLPYTPATNTSPKCDINYTKRYGGCVVAPLQTRQVLGPHCITRGQTSHRTVRAGCMRCRISLLSVVLPRYAYSVLRDTRCGNLTQHNVTLRIPFLLLSSASLLDIMT